MKRSLLLLAALFVGFGLRGEVTMPPLFGDNMVLQQQADAALWGKADAGETVAIIPSWDNKAYTAKAGADGKWRIAVPTPKAGGPYTIKVGEITLRNVLIGEVWIGSGQSNMAMTVKGINAKTTDVAKDIAGAGEYAGKVRYITIQKNAQEQPSDEIMPTEWKVPSPETVVGFGAVAYYFAAALSDRLGVPVGIINTSWGGTPIEAWMDMPSNLSAREKLRPIVQGQEYKAPGMLYNGMIRPLAGYAAKGFIWYQGEANSGLDGYLYYAAQTKAMVELWRKDWGNDKMPFYAVQIAPFARGNNAGAIDIPRFVVQGQLAAMQNLPYYGVAPTGDVGEEKNIHPSRKKEVGERLANLAAVNDYGLKGIAAAPVMKSVKITGSTAQVAFDNAPKGLMPVGDVVKGFEMAGADKVFHPAFGTVKKGNDVVVVSCPGVAAPVAVRYAFHNFMVSDLRSADGLPAFPFRTDEW